MDNVFLVRMLLRVSSRQQLDADGDLPAQRGIVKRYIDGQKDWRLDESKPEYHEFGVSGYKNAVSDRRVLQKIMEDARRRQFQILVCYKDDRLGRREDEIPAYIKELAENGVLVYTVKEGCITPRSHVDNLMTFIRYWSAQGDSMKTAQRVKDAAMEQVRMGKNQGGNAPFGYRLELSGELSKHQRALKKKVIVPEEAELVRRIYDYALTCGYGAYKIARILNEHPQYCKMARNGVWKSGTIRDMMKNPIYTGYEAYNRRSHEGGGFHRLDRTEWVLSEACNEEIKIIDREVWEKVQRMREERREHYRGKGQRDGRTPISTTGRLPLLDVAYCGRCGRKLTNGSKYNYWVTGEGEKRSSVVGYYRCQARQQGENCDGRTVVRADSIEPQVYEFVREYLDEIEDNAPFLARFQAALESRKSSGERRLQNLRRQLEACEKSRNAYEDKLPQVLCGEIPIPVEDYCHLIEKEKEKGARIRKEMENVQLRIDSEAGKTSYLDTLADRFPPWREVFDQAEPSAKRMVINKLIERIDIWEEEIRIRVRVR